MFVDSYEGRVDAARLGDETFAKVAGLLDVTDIDAAVFEGRLDNLSGQTVLRELGTAGLRDSVTILLHESRQVKPEDVAIESEAPTYERGDVIGVAALEVVRDVAWHRRLAERRLRQVPTTGSLALFRISPNFRNQGHGGDMLKLIATYAMGQRAANGPDFVLPETDQSALPFLTRYGFVSRPAETPGMVTVSTPYWSQIIHNVNRRNPKSTTLANPIEEERHRPGVIPELRKFFEAQQPAPETMRITQVVPDYGGDVLGSRAPIIELPDRTPVLQ